MKFLKQNNIMYILFKLAANAPGKRVLLVRAVLRLWRDGRVQIGLISVVEIVIEATDFLRWYCTF